MSPRTRRGITTGLLSLMSLLVVAALTRDAWATSCAKPVPESSVARADFIFSGQVVTLKHDGGTTLATMRVSRVYKGTVPSPATVTGGGIKGFGGFEVGRTYLVFGHVSGGEIFAHLCNATMTLPPSGIFVEDEWASWSVASLGPGAPPAASGTPPSAPPAAPASALPEPPAAPVSASAPTPSAAAPVEEEPAPDPHTSAPLAPAGSMPTPAPSPGPSTGGGCAGCTVTEVPASQSGALVIAMALLVAAVARRGRARRAAYRDPRRAT